MNKKILSSIGLTLVGVTLYYFLLSSTDMTWALLWDTLQQMDFTIAAMCPILVSVLIVFSALKWRLVTEAQCEEKLGLGFYFRYISLSSALGQVLPLTLTNATVRALSLKRKDVMPVMKTAGLFLWDQGFDSCHYSCCCYLPGIPFLWIQRTCHNRSLWGVCNHTIGHYANIH